MTTSAGQIAAEAELYHGEDFPVRIDTDKKTITISADCYLHLNVSVTELKEGDLPLYVEAWVLDGDGDGVLDFYVTASRLQEGEAGYKPLVVTASAQELLPLVASALPLLGIDEDILNDYFITHWVDGATAGRLSAIGDSLLETLDFFGVFDELFGGAAGGTASDELIAAVVKGEDTFSLTLGGGALGMGSDLVIGLEKTADAEGAPLLKAVSLAFGGTDIAFGLSYDTIVPAVPTLPAGQKYELDGMPELFTALANTATHTATEEEIVSGTAESADDILLNRTYFIDGSIEVDAALDLEIFEIPVKEYEVELSALAVTIEENGGITLSVRLKYGDLSVFGIDLIYGSTLDLTFKGDMIYMRRVSGGETLYRAMPLSVFGETIMDQLVFMFNMSDTVADRLSDISPEQSGSTGGDLGAQAGNILSGYEYLEESGAWKLTFNGGALTGNVLGNIVVTLGTDKNGYISSLSVSAGMEKSLFKVDLSADLTLENGGESWATEIDYNKTLSDYLANGMGAAIGENNENGWTDYLEGTKSTVSFVADGETVETQDVFVNGSEVLSELSYPVLEEREGYTASWEQSGLTFTAKYVPNKYHVTFKTENEVSEGVELGYELAYGSKIEYYVNGALRGEETVGAADMTLEMPGLTERSVWYKAEASGEVLRLYAYENYDTVTFDDGFGGTSTENYVADYALPKPTKEGYTFLGWWKQTDGAWEKVDSLAYSGGADVTLHALWAAMSVEASCERSGRVQYTYKAFGTVRVQLAGKLTDEAFFNEIKPTSISITLKTYSWSVSEEKQGQCKEDGSFEVERKAIKYWNWEVTATATLNIGGHTFTITGSQGGSF